MCKNIIFFNILATIIHLGRSASSGHYVIYIKRNGKWYYFNDSKVCEDPNPRLDKGYIYLWRRIDN